VDQTDIELLKTRIDATVQLHCKNEIVVGTLLIVSGEERDVIYDLISSNQMAGYQQCRRSPTPLRPSGSYRPAP
jgi:hypothetical protein